jgi:hypothetical protein
MVKEGDTRDKSRGQNKGKQSPFIPISKEIPEWNTASQKKEKRAGNSSLLEVRTNYCSIYSNK